MTRRGLGERAASEGDEKSGKRSKKIDKEHLKSIANATISVIQVNSTAIPRGRDPERLYLLNGDFCVYRDRLQLWYPNRRDYGKSLL